MKLPSLLAQWLIAPVAAIPLFCQAGTPFTDAQWLSLSGQSNGLDGSVNVLTVDSSGNLYVGGWFDKAGGSNVNFIAKWDGKSWSSLGRGFPQPFSFVNGPYAIVFDKAGNLYAGGNITNAGGIPVNYVAKWDGTNWSALGSGQPSFVGSLALDNAGNLYAATRQGISEWNGNTWTPLASQPGNVAALACDASNNLYAAGSFTMGNATNIAKWDGTNWSALGTGLGNENDNPLNLAFDPHGNLYACGFFTNAGASNVSCIAKWDGTNWLPLGAGMTVPLNTLLTVDGITFDGSGNLYACGVFGMAGNVMATSIAKWDGKEWSALGSGLDNNGSYSVACDMRGNLYVGGNFFHAGTNSSGFIAKALLAGPLPNQLLLKKQPGGTNVLSFLGTPSTNYALDFATNLAHPVWIAQSTNTAPANNATDAGYLTLTNSSASSAGFYRMRSVP